MSRPRSRGLVRRGVERALRLPLFWKILLANALLVAVATVAGVLLGPEFVRAKDPSSVAGIAIALAIGAVALTVLVNAVILRLALEPVRRLEETAAAILAGDFESRAPRSPLADPHIERLTDAFNEVLDSAGAYRRRLRQLMARSIREEEAERHRVARFLHDETAQRLAALLLRIRAVEGREGDPATTDLVEEAREEVGAALDAVRRYALGRRPLALDDLGLAAAVESYARSALGEEGPEVRVSGEPCPPLDPEVELALYRIVQEALDNAARHADAQRVEVRIERAAGVVRAVVEDDGRGFSVDEAVLHGALGLFEMEERAATVDGRVEVASGPGSGTRVEIRVPTGVPDHSAVAPESAPSENRRS